MSTTAATTPARQREPRPEPERFIRLLVQPEAPSTGVVRITVGAEEAYYFLTELATDYGRGFRLAKIAGEELYHVHFDIEESSCDCEGHLRWGRCKHADGLAALIAAGQL
jgi:hypothetical protein